MNISGKIKLIYDSTAEPPCHAINITFYCHPKRSEGSFDPRSFALAQDDTKIIAVTDILYRY